MKLIQENSEKYRATDGHFYITYKVTNIVNKKQYIGMHKTNKLNDNYYGSGRHICRAIKKYGIENFNFEILQYFTNIDDALIAESILVNKEWINRKDTYNIIEGGMRGSIGLKHSKKTKAKLSELNKGQNNHYFGKKHNEEIRKKISDKVIPTRKYGKNHVRAYSVRCVNTITKEDYIIESLLEYCKKTGSAWGGLYKSYINERLIRNRTSKNKGIILLNVNNKMTIDEIIKKYNDFKIIINNEIYYTSNLKEFSVHYNIGVASLRDSLYKQKQYCDKNNRKIQVFKNY